MQLKFCQLYYKAKYHLNLYSRTLQKHFSREYIGCQEYCFKDYFYMIKDSETITGIIKTYWMHFSWHNKTRHSKVIVEVVSIRYSYRQNWLNNHYNNFQKNNKILNIIKLGCKIIWKNGCDCYCRCSSLLWNFVNTW